jgi:hypothetical protein
MARRSRSSGDGGGRTDVRRSEFDRVTNALRNVNNVTREEFAAAHAEIVANLRSLEVQFRRIAQIQVELDDLKRIVARLTSQK